MGAITTKQELKQTKQKAKKQNMGSNPWHPKQNPRTRGTILQRSTPMVVGQTIQNQLQR
jgi:hypothetical protein